MISRMRAWNRRSGLALTGLLVLGCAGKAVEAPPVAVPSLVLETVEIGDDLVARRIHDRFWVITDLRPYAANSLVAVTDSGGVLFVDTPWTPDSTERLLAWVAQEIRPVKASAVNTHFHVDSLGGNRTLVENDIQIMSHSLTPTLLERRGRRALRDLRVSLEGQPNEKRKFRDFEPVPPRFFFADPVDELPFGHETYELIYPGPGHSKDNIAVWFPDHGILFGGCMVKAGNSLGYTTDADLEAWPAAIERLRELNPRIVIPGHGDRLDPGLLDHTLDLLRANASARARE